MLIIYRKRKFKLTFNPENKELRSKVAEVLSDYTCSCEKEYFDLGVVPFGPNRVPAARYSCSINDELFDDFVKDLEKRIENVGIVGLHIEN